MNATVYKVVACHFNSSISALHYKKNSFKVKVVEQVSYCRFVSFGVVKLKIQIRSMKVGLYLSTVNKKPSLIYNYCTDRSNILQTQVTPE